MDFEQIKVIWDSQCAEPLYAVDETELHAIVKRRNRAFNRRQAWCYWREIIAALFFGTLMLGLAAALASGQPEWIAPLSKVESSGSRGDVLALLIAGIVWLVYAARMWSAQRRQHRSEAGFPATLRGEIERALARTAFQIQIARSVLWWGIIPSCVASLLWIVTTYRMIGAPAWTYFAVTAFMGFLIALSARCENRKIARRFEPRRLELESLREKLNEGPR